MRMSMHNMEQHETQNRRKYAYFLGFLDFMECYGMYLWPRRQESNLHPTLRRRVHYPLCYGESLRLYSAASLYRNGTRERTSYCLCQTGSLVKIAGIFHHPNHLFSLWRLYRLPMPNWLSATSPCWTMPISHLSPVSVWD